MHVCMSAAICVPRASFQVLSEPSEPLEPAACLLVLRLILLPGGPLEGMPGRMLWASTALRAFLEFLLSLFLLDLFLLEQSLEKELEFAGGVLPLDLLRSLAAPAPPVDVHPEEVDDLVIASISSSSLLISIFKVNTKVTRIKSFKGIIFIDHDQFDLSQSAKLESAFSY